MEYRNQTEIEQSSLEKVWNKWQNFWLKEVIGESENGVKNGTMETISE